MLKSANRYLYPLKFTRLILIMAFLWKRGYKEKHHLNF